MANIWLQQVDLENATSVQSVIAAFDDTNVGAANPNAVLAIITRAEQEMLAWLIPEFGPPPLPAPVLAQLGADPFLKGCALEYAITWMYDRRPEYFRSSTADIAERLKRADARAQRVLDARQRAPTVPTKPANVGGAVRDNANRLYVDSADGTTNSGDY